MVISQDEPIADCVCIPLYYVSKLLKDSGVTVVQVGEGSDELYCGYQNYVNYLNAYNRYYQPARYIPSLVKQSGSWLAGKLFPTKTHHRALLEQWASGKHLFWSGAMAFQELHKQHLFTTPLQTSFDPILEKIYPGFNQTLDSYAVVDYHLQQLYQHKPNADFFTSMTYLELKQRLPELLLMRVDKMTMATSVEGRVPFLDHEHVEFALQIPTHLKYKNNQTKYILKKACEGILPHDIIYRKKIGFAAPITRWFTQGTYFKPYFNDLCLRKNKLFNPSSIAHMVQQTAMGKNDHSVHLWVLQNALQHDLL